MSESYIFFKNKFVKHIEQNVVLVEMEKTKHLAFLLSTMLLLNFVPLVVLVKADPIVWHVDDDGDADLARALAF